MNKAFTLATILMIVLFCNLAKTEEPKEKASFKVSDVSAKAIVAKNAGGNTVEIKATIEIKNEGKEQIGISSRIFEYKLVKKAKAKGNDEEQMFFQHSKPDLIDARPLEPGKTAKLKAELEGHTIGIDKESKYELHIKGYGKAEVIEVQFK
jgi:hypothetical protein